MQGGFPQLPHGHPDGLCQGGLLKEIRHEDRLTGTQGLPKQSQVLKWKTPLPPIGDASVPTPLSSTPLTSIGILTRGTGMFPRAAFLSFATFLLRLLLLQR